MVEDKLQFLVSDNFATGEGRTISILITRAYPRSEDYGESKSHMNADGSFHFEMPDLKEGVTPRVIALREFIELFGNWNAQIAENLSREEFLDRYGHHLPAYGKTMLQDADDSGNFKYSSQYHVNYS